MDNLQNNPELARWYAVQTRPYAETCAVAHLERQGFVIFCPRYRRVARHARRQTSVLAPLFPSYMFVRLQTSRDRWRSVNGTRGVVRLLAQGDVPTPVPPGIVEGLQAHTDPHGVLEWVALFDVGRPVRVIEGPFADLVGKLERLGPDGRVCVLLELLGRPVSVNLPCEALDPAA